MKFSIFILGLSVGLSAYAAGKKHQPEPVASPSPAPVASVQPSPIPSPISSNKIITLKCDSTCLASEVAQIPSIEAAMNATFNSECFTQYFKTVGRRFDNRNGLTQDQILAKLHQPTTLTVNYFYKSNTPEEGYESADDFSVIHMNRRFTQGWPICDIASLGAHEFTHTKQFWHNGNKAAPNYFTIPYQTNNAFEGNDDMPACCH